ncbi:MAG: hypothetical protein IKX22_09280 [Prevotella sp.]|nr:hypothetical protein [Prevotella sp.]
MKIAYKKPEIKINAVEVESPMLTGTNEVTNTDGNGDVHYGGGGDGTGPSTPHAGEGVWEESVPVSTNVWDE